MIDLYSEFKALVEELQKEGLEYALCGGLAMAVYSVPRATVDIDILTTEMSMAGVEKAAKKCGFDIGALPMSFKGGSINIRRLSKIEKGSGDVLMLDILVVTGEVEEVWRTRKLMDWDGGTFWVVSKKGLIRLKSLRGSPQDISDIEALKGAENES
jgi:hypothetical protein